MGVQTDFILSSLQMSSLGSVVCKETTVYNDVVNRSSFEKLSLVWVRLRPIQLCNIFHYKRHYYTTLYPHQNDISSTNTEIDFCFSGPKSTLGHANALLYLNGYRYSQNHYTTQLFFLSRYTRQK